MKSVDAKLNRTDAGYDVFYIDNKNIEILVHQMNLLKLYVSHYEQVKNNS